MRTVSAQRVQDNILFCHGVPVSIHSDHAQEFEGRAMAALFRKYGYMNKTTRGYCPTGNSTIESFWSVSLGFASASYLIQITMPLKSICRRLLGHRIRQ